MHPRCAVDALYEENGRVCGVICGDDFSAPVMWCWQKVPTASWLNVRVSDSSCWRSDGVGDQRSAALETSAIEERFHLENNEGAACCSAAESVMTYPAAHFFILITNALVRDCLPALFPYAKSCSASELLTRFKAHPAVRPLIKTRNHWSMVRIWCQKVACTVCGAIRR